MVKEIWEIWLENEERMQTDFEKYVNSKKIKGENT